MRRPVEFLPVYDQTQKQAAEMVEALFVEIGRLEAKLAKANGLLDRARRAAGTEGYGDELAPYRIGWRDAMSYVRDAILTDKKGGADGEEEGT